MSAKMQVEIWSDVMCPFCYIGKRKFEAALEQFEHAKDLEIVWRSFQLNPDLQYQPDKDLYDYVAEMKGQSREWSIEIHKTLVDSAKSVGLDYQLDIAKIANSFDAHRVVQLAKTKGLGDEMEERLFKAYFSEGALISEHETLVVLATQIGLQENEVRNVLQSNQYATEVRQDQQEAQRVGARGVPFFCIDRKYAVSGAQSPEVFLGALEKSFAEWKDTRLVFE